MTNEKGDDRERGGPRFRTISTQVRKHRTRRIGRRKKKRTSTRDQQHGHDANLKRERKGIS